MSAKSSSKVLNLILPTTERGQRQQGSLLRDCCRWTLVDQRRPPGSATQALPLPPLSHQISPKPGWPIASAPAAHPKMVPISTGLSCSLAAIVGAE